MCYDQINHILQEIQNTSSLCKISKTHQDLKFIVTCFFNANFIELARAGISKKLDEIVAYIIMEQCHVNKLFDDVCRKTRTSIHHIAASTFA